MLELRHGDRSGLLLEHVDHSVKVPEHVTQGLTFPLLGVVPRIRRTALSIVGAISGRQVLPIARGGRLSQPPCQPARVAGRHGPIVTLLVTSPKAGDGKSTTALNLAATCAGGPGSEPCCWMSTSAVRPCTTFSDESPKGRRAAGAGRRAGGRLPWQRRLTVPNPCNLDFMPTGDTRDIPIEILGTLELRQLLIALANHYDRVILDGPAILGMADCRMLGRLVDASVLVVRCRSTPARDVAACQGDARAIPRCHRRRGLQQT